MMLEMHKCQAEDIFSGFNELAFRKNFEAFERSGPFKVLVCTDGKVCGEFTVPEVIRIEWNRRIQAYENASGLCRMAHLTEERFTKYGGKHTVYALPIHTLRQYKSPYRYEAFGLAVPPGNYRYIGEQTYRAVVKDRPRVRKAVAA